MATFMESEIPTIIGTGNNNCGFGNGNDAWILIILFALIFGFGNNGMRGGNTEALGYELGKMATTNDVANGFAQNTLQRGIDDIILGQANNLNYINQGFAGLNNALTQGFGNVNNAICTLGYQNQTGFNQVSRELAECCCTTQRAIDGVNYNMATNTCAITNAIQTSSRDIADVVNANYRALHDELVANRIEDKNARIAELEQRVNYLNLAQSQANQNTYLINQLRPTPIPSYNVQNPYCSYNTCVGIQ